MITKEEINILKKFGRILNEEIRDGKVDPIIGRGNEIRRVTEILSRKKKNNPLLIGAAGVGKTAIVEGLALSIVNQEVPENLRNRTVFELNVSLLVSGAKMHGEFEQRLNNLLTIFRKNSDVIVFIDELHLIVGAGKTSGTSDAANILKPTLARGEIRLIGATTFDEYRRFIEKDNALERRFQTIMVSEPTADETIAILRGLKKSYENYHEISIRDEALIAAVDLSMRFIPQRKLPDKAIDLIDEAASRRKIESWSLPYELDSIRRKLLELTIEKNALASEEKSESIEQKLAKVNKDIEEKSSKEQELTKQWEREKEAHSKLTKTNRKIGTSQRKLEKAITEGDLVVAGELKYKTIPKLQEDLKALKKLQENSKNRLLRNVIDREAIGEIVTSWTKIPVSRLLTSDRERLLLIKPQILENVKGQDHIIDAVVSVIIRAHIGAADKNKPLASFIFLGPSGVGKSFLGKQLAEQLFGHTKKLIRIDMSEYNMQHSISRLIGSPPGYIGFDQGGLLTQWIKQNPYSIVLFDEFEKAHPEIQKLLLQILEEGELTDNYGRTHSFRNAILIATSNHESRLLVDRQNKKAHAASVARIKKTARERFSPELYNRFDEVLVFDFLSSNALCQIVKIELTRQLSQIQKRVNIFFEFDDSLVEQIVKNVEKERLGARPAKRFIQKNIVSSIVQLFLKNLISSEFLYTISFNTKESKINLKKKEFQ